MLLKPAVLLLLGTVVFLYGFLSVKILDSKQSTGEEQPVAIGDNKTFHDAFVTNPVFKKAIIIIIDAMRTDFLPPSRVDMKFVQQLMKKKAAVAIDVESNPPTVTMPRLKALTTGTIPGYMGFIMNFHSRGVTIDSVISQWKRQGKRVIFYGDDTWINMFPDQFTRHEGTSSFFVKDYYEVDTNVTRHLDRELNAGDWDVMILHYLGLDHIGHVEGPWSPLIGPKLAEMDDVVKKLYSSVNQDGKEDTLLVVCGDHGMADEGGHGGASDPEIHTPVVLLSPKFSQADLSWCGTEGAQVDVGSTLALLLGAPAPRHSLGRPLPPALALLPPPTALHALRVTAHQLLRLWGEHGGYSSSDPILDLVTEAEAAYRSFMTCSGDQTAECRQHFTISRHFYSEATLRLQQSMAGSLSQYKLSYMVIGVVLQMTALLLAVTSAVTRDNPTVTAALTPSRTTTCILVSLSCLAVALFYGEVPMRAACVWDAVIALATLWGAWSLLGGCLKAGGIVRGALKKQLKDLARDRLALCCVGGEALLILTLASSSLIEEQHLTVYHAATTLHVLLLMRLVASYGNKSSAGNNSSTSEGRAVLGCVTSAVILRACRSLNQTGDKWRQLPDLGDWLNRPEQRGVLTATVVLSLLLQGWWSLRLLGPAPPMVLRGVVWATVACIVRYRVAVEEIWLPGDWPASKQGVWEAQCVFALLTFLVLLASFTLRRQHNNTGTLARSLLVAGAFLRSLQLRAHNTPLTTAALLQMSLLTDAATSAQLSPVLTTFLFVWLGRAHLFMQGTSNNLSSIDVSAGYVGVSSYNLAQVAFLLLHATTSATSLPALALPGALARGSTSRGNTIGERWYLETPSHAVLISRCATSVVYCALVLLQRHHLFIWSVFAPKLLIEAAFNFLDVLRLGLWQLC